MTSRIAQYRDQINQALAAALPQPLSFPLYHAMHYCVLNGGKRLRPLLVYATGEALHLSAAQLNPLACAIELIHCYSLVHDDLPAMDNADLRRGQATCHKQYNEALAILVGDALLPLAFEILTSTPQLTDTQKTKSVQQLAQLSGAHGMVKGQVLDLAATHQQLSVDALKVLYHHKTGQLLSACILLPLLLTHTSAENTAHFKHFATCLGLAYQIQDDILDVESETHTLGKQVGIDKANHKNTFPDVVGMSLAKKTLFDLQTEALAILNSLPFETNTLRALAITIFERKY